MANFKPIGLIEEQDNEDQSPLDAQSQGGFRGGFKPITIVEEQPTNPTEAPEGPATTPQDQLEQETNFPLPDTSSSELQGINTPPPMAEDGSGPIVGAPPETPQGPTVNDLINDPGLFKVVQEAMAARMGVDYAPGGKNSDPKQIVEDFMDHNRYLDTNVLSAIKEFTTVNQLAKNPAKALAIADGYRLWDSMGMAWNTDENTAGWITDYMEAMAADPTNYATLGFAALIKKAGVGAASTAMRELVKQEAQNLIKKGVVQKAQQTIVTQPGVMSKLFGKTTPTITVAGGKKEAEQLAAQTVENTLGQGGLSIGQRAVVTGAAESGFSVAGDLAYQKARREVGTQEENDWVQTGLVGLLGATAGAYPELLELLPTKNKSLRNVDTLAGIVKKPPKAAVQQKVASALQDFILNYDWSSMAGSGRVLLDTPEAGKVLGISDEVFRDLMLGNGSFKGLAHEMADNFANFDNTVPITHNVASFMKDLPTSIKKGLSTQLKAATGFDVDQFADAMVASSRYSGQFQNTSSNVAKILMEGAVDASQMNSAEQLAKQFADEGLINTMAYTANLWRRLLVSTLQTTMLNVQGSATYLTGQAAADVVAAGVYGARDLLRFDTSFKTSKAYLSAIKRGVTDFVDPELSRQVFEATSIIRPAQMQALRDLTAFGVNDPRQAAQTMKRFKFDQLGPFWKKVIDNLEGGVDVAQTIAMVRQQDSFFKTLAFNNNLALNLELKTGKTLEQHILDGTLRENLTPELLGESIHQTSKSVFSADYGIYNKNVDQSIPGMGKAVALMVTRFEQFANAPGINFLIPFPRFMSNVVANALDWSPVGAVGSYIEAGVKMARGKGVEISAGRSGPIHSTAKAIIGTTAVYQISEVIMGQDEQDQLFNIPTGGGEYINVQNTYPASFMYLSGYMLAQYRKNGYVEDNLWQEWGRQLAFGQLAKDLDMKAVVEATTTGFLASMGAFAGGVVGGFTRPASSLNDVLSVVRDNQELRNRRHPSGFNQAFKEEATRYIDSIVGPFKEGFDVRQKASRPDDPAIVDPVGKMMGAPAQQPKSNVERLAAMSGIPAYRFDKSDTNKDREFEWFSNHYIRPLLDARAETLLKSPKFLGETLAGRHKMAMALMESVRKEIITSYISGGAAGDLQATSYMRSRLKGVKTNRPQMYRKALEAMSEKNGWPYKGSIDDIRLDDLNYNELKFLNDVIGTE